jgi:hypothetical protein
MSVSQRKHRGSLQPAGTQVIECLILLLKGVRRRSSFHRHPWHQFQEFLAIAAR